VEWLEAAGNIIQFWVWGNWQLEKFFPIMELLDCLVGFFELFFQHQGIFDNMIALVKILEVFNLLEAGLELSNLFQECLFLILKSRSKRFILFSDHVFSISETGLNF